MPVTTESVLHRHRAPGRAAAGQRPAEATFTGLHT